MTSEERAAQDDPAAVRRELGWPVEAFAVPDTVATMWRAIGQRGQADNREWQDRLGRNRLSGDIRRGLDGDVGAIAAGVVRTLKQEFAADRPRLATRASSGRVLERLVPALPFLIGGSADLSVSNLTKIEGPGAIVAGQYEGQYIHYGVREHGMAAIMNGLALHGGIIPYGGTYLAFSDYSRPAIRLAAMMKQRVIHVMTHDSIGVGEDGPTHQPVEHLAALRCIPNTIVLRPCDAIETAECWQVALDRRDGPSILVLTRQTLPTLRQDSEENRVNNGAYVLANTGETPKVVIIATGSEVEIAMQAKERLEADGLPTRVVSAPCLELFAARDQAYRDSVLGPSTAIRVGIEAALRAGWNLWLGEDGIFIGMHGFGESASAEQLYRHFGITADAVVAAVTKRLGE